MTELDEVAAHTLLCRMQCCPVSRDILGDRYWHAVTCKLCFFTMLNASWCGCCRCCCCRCCCCDGGAPRPALQPRSCGFPSACQPVYPAVSPTLMPPWPACVPRTTVRPTAPAMAAWMSWSQGPSTWTALMTASGEAMAGGLCSNVPS